MPSLPKSEASSLVDGIVSLSSVTRYHGHPVISDQTVADHSCRVAMLAFEIAREFSGGDLVYANKISTISLFHDFSEGILKNDANSSVKNKYGIRELLKQLETEVISDIFTSTESTVYRDLILESCSPEDYSVMKLADSLDFGLYLWSELMLGNKHMLPLLSSFKIETSKYPSQLLELSITKHVIAKVLSVKNV